MVRSDLPHVSAYDIYFRWEQEVYSTVYLVPLNAVGAAQTASVVGHDIRLANALRIRRLFQHLSKATTSDIWTTPKTRGSLAANHDTRVRHLEAGAATCGFSCCSASPRLPQLSRRPWPRNLSRLLSWLLRPVRRDLNRCSARPQSRVRSWCRRSAGVSAVSHSRMRSCARRSKLHY